MKATPDMYSYLSKIRHALDESAIVVVTDPQGIIVDMNDKFCMMTQYSREELLGKSHRMINSGYHPKEFFAQLWKTVLSGNKWEGEIRNRAKDGSFYWVHTHIIPFRDEQGAINELVSIRYDVTRRKNAELNLSAVLDSQFDGLLIYDLSGRICWTNQTLRNLFPETEIGDNFFVEHLFGKEFPIFKTGNFTLSLEKADSHPSYELVAKTYHYVGRAAYLLSIRDVTEKLRAEAKIIQQERLASVGVMASGLAHEIGTPLGVVRGRAEMISTVPGVPPELKANAEIIMQQIDRVSGLVSSLLKLARGEENMKPETVPLKKLLTDVIEFLRHELEKSHIQMDLRVDEKHHVNANYNPLFQVFLNLFVNAIHSIQDRNKYMKIPGHMRVSSVVDRDFMVIRVEDNGHGMTEEQQRKIFTPFFTTKDVGQGTGLGLATSYKMVQSWGGSIAVSSAPDLGAVFELRLPSSLIP